MGDAMVANTNAATSMNQTFEISSAAQIMKFSRGKEIDCQSTRDVTGHVGSELSGAQRQAQLTHKPYKGAASALNEMVGGQVDARFLMAPGVAPYPRAGKLIPLAMSSRGRSKLLPGRPTVIEAGYPVQRWSSASCSLFRRRTGTLPCASWRQRRAGPRTDPFFLVHRDETYHGTGLNEETWAMVPCGTGSVWRATASTSSRRMRSLAYRISHSSKIGVNASMHGETL